MTLYQLNGRVAKLEQHAVHPVDYTSIPAAQRQARIEALLRKKGIAPEDVAATRVHLLAMSPAERAAWVQGEAL